MPRRPHYHVYVIELPGAVWFYPEPKPEAHLVQGRVAFWKGVKIEE
ncbi:hypothetical protein GCM10027399_23690 [Curvibacter fontanus]